MSSEADCFGHPQSFTVWFGFMHPENSCAFLATKACEGHPGPESVWYCRGIGQPSKEGFPGYSDQDRPEEVIERIERSQQSEVVLWLLPETNSWVNGDAVRGHAVAYRGGNPLSKKFNNLGDHIVVMRILLHRPRLPLHMHENNSRSGTRCQLCHLWIVQQRGDIVDDIRPASEGLLRHSRLRGIDGDDDVTSGSQATDHGDDPPELFLSVHFLGSGPGRFATHIDDLGAFALHHQSLLDGILGLEEFTAVGKRIRRHIEHAHEDPVPGEIERATSKLPNHGNFLTPGTQRKDDLDHPHEVLSFSHEAVS